MRHERNRLRLTNLDQTIRMINETSAPIINLQGDTVGWVIVFRDVTSFLETQEQLRQSQKMETLGQLSGGIAHDFNNMLSGILGAADTISIRHPEDQRLQKLTSIITNSSERAAALTQRLLDFSRKGSRQTKAVDVHMAIRDEIELLKRSIDPKITIQSQLTASKHVVNGDNNQIQSLILNLAVNARDAMPNGGNLTIKTSNRVLTEEDQDKHLSFTIATGEHLVISVEDSGTGIDPEYLTKIFDPFSQQKKWGKEPAWDYLPCTVLPANTAVR